MPHTPPQTRRTLWLGLMLGALVLLRAVPHLLYPEIFFDADQAMIGIMGKDLAEGRAVPWTFYGQKYLLAVEAWAAAGSFVLGGVSLATLKLPLLLVSLVLTGLLFDLLERDARLAPGKAWAAASLLAVPSVVVSSYLLAAQGGTAWPLLYILILWTLRARSVWMGLFLGFAYFHREFVLFGFLALVVLDLCGRPRDEIPRALRARLTTFLVGFVSYHVLVGLGLFFPEFFGPGAPRMTLVSGATLWNNLALLGTDFGPTLWGMGTHPVRAYDLASTLVAGPQVWGLVNGAACLMLTLRVGSGLAVHRRAVARDERYRFPLYLLLAAGGQAAAYVLFIPTSEPVLIRYLMMMPLALVALCTLSWQLPSPRRWSRLEGATLLVVLSLTAANVTQNIRLWAEQKTHPAASPHQTLATYLLRHGYQYGWAPYWDAYYLTFLSDEKLIVAASDHTRVRRYRDRVAAHAGRAFVLAPPGHCQDLRAPIVERWQICPRAQSSLDIPALSQQR